MSTADHKATTRFLSPDSNCAWSGNSKRSVYDEANPALPTGDTPRSASPVSFRRQLVITIFPIRPTPDKITLWPGVLNIHTHSIDRNRVFLYNEFVEAAPQQSIGQGGASE
jgi:hypothetical protein